MEREKKFVLSYTKAMPEAEHLTSIVKEMVWKYPTIKLNHIKAIMGIYLKTLIKLYNIIPLSMPRSLLN